MRNILAGIGAVVVAIIVISAISSHGSGVSTTPSGSSSTRFHVQPRCHAQGHRGPGRLVLRRQDGSGDTYRVTLVKIIDPAQGADQFSTPDNGKRFVGAVFTIKAVSGSPKDEDANTDAVIVGSNGQTYNVRHRRHRWVHQLQQRQIQVAQGETTTGAVVFQVPDGVKVAKVQWTGRRVRFRRPVGCARLALLKRLADDPPAYAWD